MRTVYCSACGSIQQRHFLSEGEYNVVTCVECGHLYTSPLRNAATNNALYQSSSNWIKSSSFDIPSVIKNRVEQYARELEHLLEPGGQILEIGCSKGHFLKLMQKRGFEVWGIEPSRDSEMALQLVGEGRIQRGLYDVSFPGDLDAIVMFEVLEHIPEPHKIVKRVFNNLRQGGYFMGSVPNGEFIRFKTFLRRKIGLQKLIVPLIMDAGNHINYFSAAGIQRMLETNGFEFIWAKNAPLEFNYIANSFSPFAKRIWWAAAETVRFLSDHLIGSNLWFLARRRI
jgi:2-polyprenyl-3-methyl-5-hydroxy-6-metoxy-1,4-benzoquinol methylase/Zn ribbon nucleic-acid-binding protein